MLRDQAALWEKVGNAMSGAMNASQQLQAASEQSAESSNNQADAANRVTQAMQENTGGADGLAAALGRNSDASKQAQSGLETLSDKAGKATTAYLLLKTAMDTVSNVGSLLGGTFDLLTGGLQGIVGIAQSAVGVVTGFFTGLFKAASQYRNKAGREMFEANQAIIEQFGNLDDTQGKFVKTMSSSLGEASSALKGAGNSLYAAIGNSAAILKEMTALAGDFGDSLVFLQDQIGGAVSELVLMKKGMGLTGDAMKNLGSLAQSSGGSLQDSLQEGMVASAHLSKQFGVDVKIIGKGLNAMASDMETFGHLSVKEMAAVATYSAKLGVEINALKGVMDKFDNFESAAQSAGQLAEAFGMNVDAMAMMNAENPAERIDMLRQSLAETGKSFDELSRHEKKLMAQTMGMDMSSLQNAMSVDPDELGFDDFGDAAEEAAEKMTPEQAMQNVAESIKKMSHAFENMTSGPLSEFVRGFMQVLERSPEFKAILDDVASFMKEFFYLGRLVGEQFMTFMRGPGKGVLDQLRNIFNLERIQAFKDQVAAAFTKFFDALKTDPKKAVEDLLDDVIQAVTDWGSATGAGAQGMGDMLSNIIEGGIQILHGLIPKLMTKMSEWIVSFTEFLRDTFSGDTNVTGNLTDGIGGALAAAMQDIGAVWSDRLWPAISDLMGLLWEKASPFVYSILFKGFLAILGFALLKAAIAVAAGAIVKKVGATIAGALKGVTGEVNNALPKDSQPGSEEQTKMIEGTKSMFQSLMEIDQTQVIEAGKNLLIISAFLGGAMLIFAAAIAGAAFALSATSWSDFGKALVGTIIGIGGSIALAKAGAEIDPADVMKGIPGLLAGALLFTAGVIVFSLAVAAASLVMEGVSWGALGKVIIATAAGIVGSIGIAMAAQALAAAAAGPQGVVAIAGLLAGAALFTVGVIAFAGAITLAAKIMGNIAWPEFAKMLAGLGVVIVATLAMVGVGALLGNPIGLTYMGLAALGLPAAAALFTVGTAAFAAAIIFLMNKMQGINLDKTQQALAIMGTVMQQTSDMITLAAPYARVLGFGKSLASTENAIMAIGDMSTKMFEKFAIIIMAIERLPIRDPKMFALKMDAIGNLIKAVSGLAQLGIDAADIANTSSLLGGGKPEEMMKQMSQFIQGTINSISGLIAVFAIMARGMTEEDLKGASAIASIIAAVSEMSAAMIAPLSSIIAQDNDSYFGTDSQGQIKSLTGGMASILDTLKEKLPTIVSALITATGEISDPDTFLKKTQALEAGMKGIGVIADTVGKLWNLAVESDDSWFGEDTEKTMGRMFQSIAVIMAPGGALHRMVKNLAAMLTDVTFPEATIAENFGKGVDTIIRVTEKLIKFAEYYTEAKQEKMNALGQAMMGWTDTSSSVWGPSDLVKLLVKEAKTIADSMGALEIDLQNILLKPILDDVLGASGERKFTIEPKGVNITVNFNVEMNAEQLATQIYKGNKKNGKEGFFQLTPQVNASELEGGRGT